MDGDVPRPLSDTFHFGASMQLGYFSSSSDPVPTPIVDEANHAIIGLARAEVSINDENDAVIGLAHTCASTKTVDSENSNALSLANFLFSRPRFDLLARDTNFQYPLCRLQRNGESEAMAFLLGTNLLN